MESPRGVVRMREIRYISMREAGGDGAAKLSD